MNYYVQDLAARNVIVDEYLVCKISAMDHCEDLNRPKACLQVQHYFVFIKFLRYFDYVMYRKSENLKCDCSETRSDYGKTKTSSITAISIGYPCTPWS